MTQPAPSEFTGGGDTRQARTRNGSKPRGRLDLSLEPIVPFRTPQTDSELIVHGFHLRVSRGPLLSQDDPLLVAFGVQVVAVEDIDEHSETLQHEGFDPGREVYLEMDADEEGLRRVGVVDTSGVRRVGALPEQSSAVVCAAVEHGLRCRAIVLQEARRPPDNRRAGLKLALFADSLVKLPRAVPPRYRRPVTTGRRRVVLVADGSSKLGWWSVAADAGPGEIADLPVSPELTAELNELGCGIDRARRREDRACSRYERYDLETELDDLDERAQALWRRARIELRRDFVVGFLGRGMGRPAWAPDEVAGWHDADHEPESW
jgi:hypothetical protein